VAAAERAREVAAQAEAGLVGTLRIGVVTAALSEPLIGALTAFQRARPHVDLRVIEVDTPQGQRALVQHRIDIAAIRLSAPSRDLTARPWRRDHFVIALPEHHPAAKDTLPVDLERFSDEPWVWLHRDASPDYHDQLMATCRRAGFTPDVHHLANTITTQLTMVACGLGVTLVPNTAAQAIPSPTVHRPLTDDTDLVELSLVTRSATDEPLVREFIRIAYEHGHG
jgi:DNA-binding transcriptional LysR family regulator